MSEPHVNSTSERSPPKISMTTKQGMTERDTDALCKNVLGPMTMLSVTAGGRSPLVGGSISGWPGSAWGADLRLDRMLARSIRRPEDAME